MTTTEGDDMTATQTSKVHAYQLTPGDVVLIDGVPVQVTYASGTSSSPGRVTIGFAGMGGFAFRALDTFTLAEVTA